MIKVSRIATILMREVSVMQNCYIANDPGSSNRGQNLTSDHHLYEYATGLPNIVKNYQGDLMMYIRWRVEDIDPIQ